MPVSDKYPYLRILGALRGRTTAQISADVERARVTGAPPHTTHFRADGTWATTDDLREPQTRRHLRLSPLPLDPQEMVKHLVDAMVASPALIDVYGLAAVRNQGADTVVLDFRTGSAATLKLTLHPPGPATPARLMPLQVLAPAVTTVCSVQRTLIGSLDDDGRTYHARACMTDGYPASLLVRLAEVLHGIFHGRPRDLLAQIQYLFLADTTETHGTLHESADLLADWMYLFTADSAALRVFYRDQQRNWQPYKDFPLPDLANLDPISVIA